MLQDILAYREFIKEITASITTIGFTAKEQASGFIHWFIEAWMDVRSPVCVHCTHIQDGGQEEEAAAEQLIQRKLGTERKGGKGERGLRSH